MGRRCSSQTRVKKRTPCPLQLILVASEGPGLSLSSRMGSPSNIIWDHANSESRHSFISFPQVTGNCPQRSPNHSFLLGVSSEQTQFCAGPTCVRWNFCPSRIPINLFWEPMHQQFCARSLSVSRTNNGKLPKQMGDGPAACSMAPGPCKDSKSPLHWVNPHSCQQIRALPKGKGNRDMMSVPS